MSTRELSMPGIYEYVHQAVYGHRPDDYVCHYRRKQFQILGGPCFLNRYEAELRRHGKVLHRWSFHRRVSAERQCLRWVRMHDAVIINRMLGHP